MPVHHELRQMPALCTVYIVMPETMGIACIAIDLRSKKFCYVAVSRPTVKCENTGSGFFFFFFFFMLDLGEEFAKICIQWLKKALA